MKLSIYNLALGLVGLIALMTSCSSDQQQFSEQIEGEQSQQGNSDEYYDDNESANYNQYEQGNDGQYEQGNEGDDDIQGNEYGNSVDENYDNQTFNNDNYSGNNNNNQFFSQDQNYNNYNDQSDSQPTGNSLENSQYGGSNVATSLDPSSTAEMNGPHGNLEEFRRHFSSFLAGHPEGVFYVIAGRGSVHLGPNRKYEIVGYLDQGAPVHAVKIEDGWAKIGRAQYVSLEDLRNAGLRTRGIEVYYKSLEDLFPPEYGPVPDMGGNENANNEANVNLDEGQSSNSANYNQNYNNSNFNQNNNEGDNNSNFNQNYNDG